MSDLTNEQKAKLDACMAKTRALLNPQSEAWMDSVRLEASHILDGLSLLSIEPRHASAWRDEARFWKNAYVKLRTSKPVEAKET